MHGSRAIFAPPPVQNLHPYYNTWLSVCQPPNYGGQNRPRIRSVRQWQRRRISPPQRGAGRGSRARTGALVLPLTLARLRATLPEARAAAAMIAACAALAEHILIAPQTALSCTKGAFGAPHWAPKKPPSEGGFLGKNTKDASYCCVPAILIISQNKRSCQGRGRRSCAELCAARAPFGSSQSRPPIALRSIAAPRGSARAPWAQEPSGEGRNEDGEGAESAEEAAPNWDLARFCAKIAPN